MSASLMSRLSASSGLPYGDVYRIVQTAPLRYKIFFIEKRSGGMREIAQPAREVKLLQRLMAEELAEVLPVHDAATAYVTGGSVRKNAVKHAGSRFLLKMDFKDFFPSIQQSDLEQHIAKHGGGKYSEVDVRAICHLALWVRNRQPPRILCIGAPSSPFISNTVMYDFDAAVSQVALERGVTYSRYADDLSFSSNTPNVLAEVERHVGDLVARLDYPKLTINGAKTVHASKKGRRVVTGVILRSDEGISAGRERKRRVRARHHQYLLGTIQDPKEVQRIQGEVAFVCDLDPLFRDQLLRQARRLGFQTVWPHRRLHE